MYSITPKQAISYTQQRLFFANWVRCGRIARMDTALEILQTVLMAILNFALFVVMSLLFLPSFFIVTYLQKPWEEKMKEVLGL
jgi:hypothetical protein